MKRRSFLGLLGAAVAAPVLPASAAPVASYNRYIYGLAVFHARTRAHVSARGIAFRLKVSLSEAEAMIAEMSEAGLVRPIAGPGGSVRAVSNILRPDTWGLDRAARSVRSTKQHTTRGLSDSTDGVRRGFAEPDLSRLLAYLKTLAARQSPPAVA